MVGEFVCRLPVVDAHVHLWDCDVVDYPWLNEPAIAYSGDNRLLPRRYRPAELRQDAADVDLRMSVHVEANPSDPLAEATWLQSVADDPQSGGHPHGIVAGVDLSAETARASLEALTGVRNVRGIRQILNVHADARFDYVGRHFLREPLWRRNLARLEDFALSFDLQLYPTQVADALTVVDANPKTPFILNHAGMFVDRDSPLGWRQWRQGLAQLAARDNTVVKLSGFLMFDHHWTIESVRPYVLATIEAFGAARCLFASNFPIDGLHSEYGRLWAAYAQIVAGASKDEKEALFFRNAVRVYRLGADPGVAD